MQVENVLKNAPRTYEFLAVPKNKVKGMILIAGLFSLSLIFSIGFAIVSLYFLPLIIIPVFLFYILVKSKERILIIIEKDMLKFNWIKPDSFKDSYYQPIKISDIEKIIVTNFGKIETIVTKYGVVRLNISKELNDDAKYLVYDIKEMQQGKNIIVNDAQSEFDQTKPAKLFYRTLALAMIIALAVLIYTMISKRKYEPKILITVVPILLILYTFINKGFLKNKKK